MSTLDIVRADLADLRLTADEVRMGLRLLSLTPAERVAATESVDFIESALRGLAATCDAVGRRERLSKALVEEVG